jgi:hypothetical protein
MTPKKQQQTNHHKRCTKTESLVNVGDDCPIFEGLFEYCQLSSGGSMGKASFVPHVSNVIFGGRVVVLLPDFSHSKCHLYRLGGLS